MSAVVRSGFGGGGGLALSAVTPAEGDLLSWDSANSVYSPRKATPGLNLAFNLPPVTARALHPTTVAFTAAANQQTMTRLRHYAVTDIYDMRLVYVNSYSDGDGLTGLGIFTLEVAVENAQGLIRHVTFNGAKTVTLSPGGIAVSDPIGMATPGPLNANPTWALAAFPYFFTRQLTTLDAAGGKTPRIEAINTGIGDCCETGVGLTNKVMSGTILTTGADPYGPAAIVGVTSSRQPVVMAFGDSITAGTGDTPTVGTPPGFVLRALYNGKIPSVRHGVASQQCSELSAIDSANPTKGIHFTIPFLLGCSHAICQYGINDINTTIGNVTDTVLETRWIAAWKMLAARGVKVYQTTLLPYTTSTDAWVTVVNQTVTATEPRRLLVNNWLRDGAPVTSITNLTPVATGTATAGTLRAGSVGHPLTGYFESADLAESARDSGKWKANYTADGVHPSPTGAAAIAVSITTATFTV